MKGQKFMEIIISAISLTFSGLALLGCSALFAIEHKRHNADKARK
jgi:TRAP-type C4-dicarboxylate transport system permease small subunit